MKRSDTLESSSRVKEVFARAIEVDPADRKRLLDELCGDDPSLRQNVESWLGSFDKSENYLEDPVFSTQALFARESDHGRIFGNYRIEHELGHGGMGSVFLALRNDGHFEHRVALKIVRRSLAEEHVIERFKQERRILASLSNTNIARLLDGGVSENGEPFLVMEYVEGEPITEFAERRELSVNERLRLFLKVCSGVAYAHRNLVVHRDIKPGNILVDADGEPKLLDFGLAKLLDEDVEHDQLQTQPAFRALTPAYASPEQLRGDSITTVSDVYSLGVVLYELLTGQRPYEFEGKTLDEIIRTITASHPSPPSRIEASGPQLKGDLDNILLTALRAEPERRYHSVEHFSEDIRRFLKGQPVTARRNSVTYRTRKFIRRHRLGVISATLILISLLASVVISVSQARIADKEKQKAEAVNSFLLGMMNYSDNSSGLSRRDGHDTTVKEVLAGAAERLDAGYLADQPDIRAELQRIVGASLVAEGNYATAELQLRSALGLEDELYGPESLESLPTQIELGQVFLAKGDYESAEKGYQTRLSILRREVQKGRMDPAYLLVGLNDYALLRRARGNSKEAELLLREALDLKPKISHDNDVAVGTAESVLALTLADQGKFDEAESIVRSRLAEIRARSDQETTELATNLTSLGNFLMEKGELDESLRSLMEGEGVYRRLTGPAFLPLGDNLRIQAQVLYLGGDLAAAETKINEALAIYTQTASPEYINYPAALTIRGSILTSMKRAAEAEPILREALRLRLAKLPESHFLSALAMGALGECLTAQRRFDEAENLLSKSYSALRDSQGEQNPRTIKAKERLELLTSLRAKCAC